MEIIEKQPQIGMKIGDWRVGYATIIDFRGEEIIWEMNYPGHDGCRWTYGWNKENWRKSMRATSY